MSAAGGGLGRLGRWAPVALAAKVGLAAIVAVAAMSLSGTRAVGLAAQVPAQVAAPRVTDVRLTPDTVRFADRFEIQVELVVPDGATAYVPDLLPGTDSVESLAPVAWTVGAREPGGTRVTLSYPMVAFQVGTVPLPAVHIRSGPPPTGGAVDSPAPTVLSERALETVGAAAGPLSRVVAAPNPAVVTSLLSFEQIAGGIEPRPADDVIGRSWSVPLVLSGLVFASLLIGITYVSGRDVLAARAVPVEPQEAGDPVDAARDAALAELDRLIAAATERADVPSVYEASSAAVRRYVEHLDPGWSDAHTSSELMGSLTRRRTDEGRGEAAAVGEPLTELVRQMAVAERVKFGRLRPHVGAAVEHCRTLRAWVAQS